MAPLSSSLFALLLAAAPLQEGDASSTESVVVGPALGHVDATSAHVWLRAAGEGTYALEVDGPGGTRRVEAKAEAARDWCVAWKVDGLTPGADHRYRVLRGDAEVATGRTLQFCTATPDGSAGRTRLAFGSCAASNPSSVWSAMELRGIDGLVLLGDTPYIDSRDLSVARSKHRAFLQVPELARLLRGTPMWGTWDDHDFGGNDVDGRMEGKEHTRRAFVEYRALASYGHGDQGIYTSFRRGGIEVFLIDARWFARTERARGSAAEAGEGEPRWSLLGEKQWRWLEEGLVASTAPFKVLATGMIWDDKRNTESDDWGAFPHERERLERFLGERQITGAVLMGGDIHVSRHLSYPATRERVGYVLDQFIVSPLHERTIASLNTEHPALLWSAVEPRVFLTLTVDTTVEDPTLTARWIQDTGVGAGRVLHEVQRVASELRR